MVYGFNMLIVVVDIEDTGT